VLEGADLIDGSGAPVIENSMVVLEGSRISYAGPKTDRFKDQPAQYWPLRGKTIVPGLIEAHTHAAFDADMRAYVKNGVTTIRFAGLNQATVEGLRERINRGALIGPRILSCGPMIDQPPPAYPEWSVAVGTPTEAAAAAERLIRVHDLEALILTQRVTAPVMRAVIEVAHAHGRPVVGQTWEVDGKEAAALGIDELHTSSRVYESKMYPRDRLLCYASIADRLALTSRAWASIDWAATQSIMETMVKHGVVYCGMQVITQFQVGDGAAELEADSDFATLFGEEERQAFRDFTRRLQGGWTQEDLDYGRAANEQRMEWMRRFRGLGGVLIAGTDMQFGGIMLHRELRNLEALGMSRLEVITAATGGCARALRLDNELGMVRDGLRADLVVLRRDPINDLGALRDIECVFKDGTAVWSDGSAGDRSQDMAKQVPM
jgi:cytosine/adenosine deaminase-related metal-dependent hydrolase